MLYPLKASVLAQAHAHGKTSNSSIRSFTFALSLQYAVLRGYDLLRSGVLGVGYQAVWELLSHPPLTDEEVCDPAGMLRPIVSYYRFLCQKSSALKSDSVPSQ